MQPVLQRRLGIAGVEGMRCRDIYGVEICRFRGQQRVSRFIDLRLATLTDDLDKTFDRSGAGIGQGDEGGGERTFHPCSRIASGLQATANNSEFQRHVFSVSSDFERAGSLDRIGRRDGTRSG